ncbi:hypothetical protein GYMLUDRAFT_47117 [Collybiopsis luxurians FD-317 M1]|uniref:Nitrogen regulatory protein areA GATA-like domain-containing protein n=1 Tax=Collybiopsis luxurians FD-317 M1 TaxID=944289 RepID=A0A0D0CE60_9AGAR|nr:hypothetical protein GYMLUDRAFT_47117 [Collybiopsis luxurians FD-317 M1]
MSNYLPVLLYSVGANVVPDDSALTTTQPRGQVDYLSHEWEEEDVWRSWRNMTRQKNEIANGVRLENASWRTWWKQRNKLKTISPETLNWLKDSDVTWLYGPLHTAVEWTPPPKPKPHETEHKMASTHDRLDLSEPKHKSILKYRTISELLTGDLPSPLFSPAESDNEPDGNQKSSRDVSDADSSASSLRPSLSQTKSDTHITRWGPDRAFRKDSPPRVEPTGGAYPAPSTNDGPSDPSHHVSSTPNAGGYFASQIQGQNEQPSSSSSSPKDGSTEVTPTGSVQNGHRRRHITFNTFVEQCIAIDKPKPKDTAFGAIISEEDGWSGRNDPAKAGYDDGYDEDGEDGFGDWEMNECAIGTDSESDVDQEALMRGENASDDEDEDEDGIIEMRPRRDSFNNKNNARLRSSSKVSSSSSSSSGECSSSASVPCNSSHSSSNRKNLPPHARRRKRSEGPNHILLPRKNSSSLPRNSSSTALSSSDKDMVSIAPIAPTMLKTGNYTSWDGFGMQSPYQHPAAGTWSEGFGDEGFSDDGSNMRVGPGGAQLYFGNGNGSDSESGTPVGLVYMPPPSTRYGGSRIPRVHSSASLDSEAEVELREDSNQEEADKVTGPVRKDEREDANKEYHHHEASISVNSDKDNVRSNAVPIVVRTPPTVQLAHGSLEDGEKDACDYFSGPDLGEDFSRNSKSSSRRKPQAGNDHVPSPPNEGKLQATDEEPRGRSRSRSRSRTPSPTYVPKQSTPAISVPYRSEHTSPPPSSSLLSPPQRGRGSVPSDPPSSSRGRSSKTSSSHSDHSRSRSSHSSPLGSLSPEGIGSAYSAHGRGGGDREREREPSSRGGGRGRERTERRLSHSVSPDAMESVSSQGSDTASVNSSSFSSQTVVPQYPPTAVSDVYERSSSPVEISPDEDRSVSSYPTPSNSPVISMSGAAHAIARMNGKAPINITNPQVSSPSLSSPSLSYPSTSNEPSNAITSSASPPSPENRAPPESIDGANDDAGVVGKAVGMVSSAGAYLGFWNNGNTL